MQLRHSLGVVSEVRFFHRACAAKNEKLSNDAVESVRVSRGFKAWSRLLNDSELSGLEGVTVEVPGIGL